MTTKKKATGAKKKAPTRSPSIAVAQVIAPAEVAEVVEVAEVEVVEDRRWPWTDVTFAGVYWNDPDRVYELLKHVRPWFKHIVVGVQTDDAANDPTYDRARRWADQVIVDRVIGYCEPTISKVLAKITTPWVFLVSADEWPSESLLRAFQDMVDMAAANKHDGFWIRMLSSIEGVPYPSESDNHLRVFQRQLGWPPTMHSRPPARRAAFWRPEDILRHDRSLDEMMQDYLRYYRLGSGNPGWVAHNRQMMLDACTATAQHHGWDLVKAFDWWPQVREIAFNGFDPVEAQEEPNGDRS